MKKVNFRLVQKLTRLVTLLTKVAVLAKMVLDMINNYLALGADFEKSMGKQV